MKLMIFLFGHENRLTVPVPFLNVIVMIKKTPLLAMFAFAVVAAPVMAAPLSALETLQQFNLVVLQNANSNSHVDGRSYVGGAATGGIYASHSSAMTPSSYAGLTVGGSASGLHVNNNGAVVGGSISNFTVNQGQSAVMGAAANGNFNGTAYVAGAAANVNFNGGGRVTTPTSIMQTGMEAAGSTNFGQVMDALSQQLSLMASTGSTVSITGNKATFNAVADANGLAVFDLTLIDTQLFSLGEFQFNLGNAVTVLFNTDNTSYNFSTNFLGGSAQLLGTKAIWNFYNAENITINNQFGGVILATDAALSNYQNLEGTVIVESLNQHGEIHYQKFGGTLPQPHVTEVPEPSMLLLMALGLCVMALQLKSRRH